jgi:hypothetical protein
MEIVKRVKKEKARSPKSANRRIETGRKMPIDKAEWDSRKVHPLEERLNSFLNNKGNSIFPLISSIL